MEGAAQSALVARERKIRSAVRSSAYPLASRQTTMVMTATATATASAAAAAAVAIALAVTLAGPYWQWI